MKRIMALLLTLATGVTLAAAAAAEDTKGAELFKARCQTCHPSGGNIIRKNKTLHKQDMEANNVRTVEDIVRLIRSPGPAMPKLDEKALSDEDARAVARYIMETFK